MTTAVPCGTVTCTIVGSTGGPDGVTGATVTDTLPAGISSATWTCTPAANCGVTSGTGNINTTVNLANGGTATFTVTANISASATGSLTNTASVTAPAGTTDPTPGNNTATDTDTLTPHADLSAAKSGPASVTAGGAISYSVLVSNGGPAAADGASFTDPLPAGISSITASCGSPTGGAVCGAVNVSGSAVSSSITTLPAGGSVTFTINGI